MPQRQRGAPPVKNIGDLVMCGELSTNGAVSELMGAMKDVSPHRASIWVPRWAKRRGSDVVHRTRPEQVPNPWSHADLYTTDDIPQSRQGDPPKICD